MSQEKKYWKSEVELKPNDGLDKIRHDEFVEKLPVEENIFSNDSVNNADTNRRDFLKYLGFSTTAAVLASCEGPVHKSVPYVLQPDRIIPGIANYYATTLFDGFDSANVLVKTREGRPIKIENTKFSSPSRTDAKKSMEALIHHFKYYSEGIAVPEGDVFVGTEAPKGELSVYLVSDGSPRP